MPSNEIESLTRQLSLIRIRRERAIQEVEAASAQETLLLRQIHDVRSATTPTKHHNTHRHGNKVRIINKLRDKFGIVGVVLSNSNAKSRFVNIREPSSNKRYTRAWWNLEAVSKESK